MNGLRKIAILSAALIPLPLLAAEKPAEAILARTSAAKLEVRHSMTGFRDTLLFFTYPEQNRILKIQIGNSDRTFPATGTIYQFAGGTTRESLDKWINNQHSDGLFIDAPEPTGQYKLPVGTCRVTSVGINGEQKNPVNEEVYQDHEVELTVVEHRVEGQFHLKPFKEKTGVFLKKP